MNSNKMREASRKAYEELMALSHEELQQKAKEAYTENPSFCLALKELQEHSELYVFYVTHHTSTHECTTTVISTSPWEASKLVKGQVMNVGQGEYVGDSVIVNESGWNFNYCTPLYKSPSKEWQEYLKNLHMNNGEED